PAKLLSAMTNARPTTPGPTTVGTIFLAGDANAVTPFTRKPRNGRSAIAQSSVGWNSSTYPPFRAPVRARYPALTGASPAQQVEAADVDRLEVAEDRDDQRQSHGGLGRRDGHHEEHEDLSLDPDGARKRDERQVHGIQHQLDAEEQDDGVPAEHDPGRADREEDRRENERLRQHVTPSAWRGSRRRRWRRAAART